MIESNWVGIRSLSVARFLVSLATAEEADDLAMIKGLAY